uniref:Uncharacterized protein n=1 Tax=Romanomermis culicivorax TaxID=13658 RepID=A0A915ITX1_ROMCU
MSKKLKKHVLLRTLLATAPVWGRFVCTWNSNFQVVNPNTQSVVLYLHMTISNVQMDSEPQAPQGSPVGLDTILNRQWVDANAYPSPYIIVYHVHLGRLFIGVIFVDFQLN